MPPDDLAADPAAMGTWNLLFLQSCTAKVAHDAGEITDSEHAQLDVFYAHMLAAARGASEETIIEIDADDLGIDLRKARDTLARGATPAQKQVRLARHQGPNRRPPRGSRRRRSVRTRRAKARAPSGDDSEPEPTPLAGVVRLNAAVQCWAHELRRQGARRAAA
jgi:hypothetical protein